MKDVIDLGEQAHETDKQVQKFLSALSYYERLDLLTVIEAAARGKVFGVKQEQAKQLLRRYSSFNIQENVS